MEGVKEDKDLLQSIDELQSELRSYANVKLELLKIEAAEKLAKGTGALATAFIIGLLFVLVLLFGSLMVAIFLGQLWNNEALGFGVVASFYAILFLIVLVFRKPIVQSRVSNWVVALLFEREEEHG